MFVKYTTSFAPVAGCSVRVVMDRNGIKRLEADESMGLRKPLRPFTRAVARLSTLPTLQVCPLQSRGPIFVRFSSTREGPVHMGPGN